MRADLHVHSYFSGYSNSLKWYRSRDCYSSPEAIYRRAKARGMDLVTITDHNTIDGCVELLDRNPHLRDFIIGEEVECRYPGTDLRIHVGVLGLDLPAHRELQRLRGSVFDVAAFLTQSGLFFTVHHLFHLYRMQVPLDQYLSQLLPRFPGIEVRNGMMGTRHNELIEWVATAWTRAHSLHMACVGGSDAHTLEHIGMTFTEAAGDSLQSFLAELKAGRSQAGGAHGGPCRLAYEIYGVIFNFWLGLVGFTRHECAPSERIRGLFLSALSLPFMFIPMVTSVLHSAGESRRAARYEELLRVPSVIHEISRAW